MSMKQTCPAHVNETELTQMGEGLFTEGRWRKRTTAEVLPSALSNHIKRHPSEEPSETRPTTP